jgi:hypothetical protein
LRITDLDRLYKQEQKRLSRTVEQAFEDQESYHEIDDKMIFRRVTAKGMYERPVAEWSARIVECVVRVDEEGDNEHLTVLELTRQGKSCRIEVPSETFGDDNALRRFLSGRAGVQYTVRAGMAKHLTPAILALSGDYLQRSAYRFMGWKQIDGKWVYLTPGACISKDGLLEDRSDVMLESRLRDYKLSQSDWGKSLEAFKAMVAVFPSDLAPTLIAFACLPLFQRFFPDAAPKPALHLVGTTGSGKSEIAALMTSLYGDFSRDAPPAQWGDTINTVEVLGNSLIDALYWVDDYKDIYADPRTFTRFMQSYSRTMGRGRLTREAKLRVDHPCRGHILSTGETTLTGEASVLARMITLDIPPWRKRDPTGKALDRATDLREYLPGFTAHLAQWIATQAETADFQHDIAERYRTVYDGYKDHLATMDISADAAKRVVTSWVVLNVVYQLLRQFLMTHDADDALPGWKHRAVESARAMQDERVSTLYLDLVLQIRASGRGAIPDLDRAEDAPPNVPILGYKQAGYVYLIPDVAYREVSRMHPLNFSVQAIGNQLKEDGLLMAGESNLSVQKRLNGARVRVWQFHAKSFE